MNRNNRRVVLITGASSGIGKACAHYLYEKGYYVYGTSRHAQWMSSISFADECDPPRPFLLIPMDVTDDASVKQGVEWVLAREGRIDVLVNNAGYGLAGAVEDTMINEARDQLEVNFFGVVRVCQAVLPIMRQQGQGYIVNISSIGGLIGIPFQGVYSASKFAVEGFTEALRMEVQPYGIQVVLVEPGDFRTGITVNRRKAHGAQVGSAYFEKFVTALRVTEMSENFGPLPEKIGHLLERIVKARVPRLRYSIGSGSERLAIFLKRILPSRVFEWTLMKYYKLL